MRYDGVYRYIVVLLCDHDLTTPWTLWEGDSMGVEWNQYEFPFCKHSQGESVLVELISYILHPALHPLIH